MIIDVHGHVSAPDALYAYKANVLSPPGSHPFPFLAGQPEEVAKEFEQAWRNCAAAPSQEQHAAGEVSIRSR